MSSLPNSLPDDLLHDDGAPFLTLLSNELGGIYLIQDGRFVYASPRLAAIFGYTQQQLCGRLGPLDLTAAHDRQRIQHEIDRRLSGAAGNSQYRFTGIRQDGSELEIEVFGSVTEYHGRPAIIGLLLDITARRQAEKQVQEQLNFISQLIDAIPSPVFYKDAQGRYLGCNSAFERYIGIDRTRLLCKSVYDISPRELAERYHAADQALFDHPGTQVYEARVESADKGRRDVMFYKATFNNTDGTLGGLVGVILDITERKQAEAEAWQHANFDTLTGLPNRRLLHDRLSQELAHAHRGGEKLVLMFIDLDRFKEVNDTLGHARGDRLLQQAAERIRRHVHESGTVARQGGDEFIVVLPQLQHPGDIDQVAQAIIDSLAEPFVLGSEQAHISASVGIACYPDDATGLDALLSSADQAMYDAKMQGRNRFSYFSRAMQLATLERLQLGRELRQALARQELQVHFQPIVELAGGRTNKAEALLRWQHPRLGTILPAVFVPLAEELGMIHQIGDWVFQQAAAMAQRWQQLEPAQPIQVSVNQSPRQITTGSTHLDWPAHLAGIGLPGRCIGIEITENALLDARPETAARLAALRAAGMCIGLDDFGTGYSALGYLRQFTIDCLKIDQSFIRDMPDNSGARAIVEAIIAMGHKLGLKIVAEGVETEAQRALLLEYGCDYAQGYLFAEPLPADEFFRSRSAVPTA